MSKPYAKLALTIQNASTDSGNIVLELRSDLGYTSLCSVSWYKEFSYVGWRRSFRKAYNLIRKRAEAWARRLNVPIVLDSDVEARKEKL